MTEATLKSCLPIVLLISTWSGFALAQQKKKDCVPPCQPTFVCCEGACVSACNPPCPSGETCTVDGECVASAVAPQAVPESPTPVPAPTEPAAAAPAAPAPTPPPVPGAEFQEPADDDNASPQPDAEDESADGRRFSASAIFGLAMPADALDYGVGFGLKGTFQSGLLHLGAGLLIHQGDETEIDYGDVGALGVDGGKQTYSSTPLFVVADGGVAFKLPIGNRSTVFAPFVSMGVAHVSVSSSGEYAGNSDTSLTNFAFGWGLLYRVPLAAQFGLGIDYRMYPIGDGDFEFGDLSQGTISHGYSTSLFYHALFSELFYAF